MSGLVSVLLESRDRGTFAVEDASVCVEVEMMSFEDFDEGEDFSWMDFF